MRGPKLTYGNVLSTVVVFAVLFGGVAYAANQLAKNSVGTKQLKKNSVTAKKIKKNAVTAAKIKKGAVNGAKVKDGAVTGAKIDASSTPFSHLVARIRGNQATPFGPPVAYPLENPTYVQRAGEVNQFVAWADIAFSASCEAPREATAVLLLDSPGPLAIDPKSLIGVVIIEDLGIGPSTVRGQFASTFPLTLAPMSKAPPATDVQHNFLLLLVDSECSSGDGVSMSSAGIDVLGIR
jgi:hypothetical protein